MKNAEKIICFFLKHREQGWSIYAVSKKLNMNYRIVFEEIKKLEREGILTLKKIGNTNLCTYNYRYAPLSVFAEQWRRNGLLRNKSINVLSARLQRIENPFIIMIVFGSYAKNAQTKHSDIDICIIADHGEAMKKALQIIRTTALPIHVLEFSPEEFLSMLKTTDNNVGKEILKNNIILKGIEAFYVLVNHA